MGRIRVYPYKQGSRSATALARALGIKVLRLRNSKFRKRPNDLIINWGASHTPWESINDRNAVANASNKLNSFHRLKEAEISIPEFWTNKADIPEDAYPIVCRTLLNSHSGRGIVVAETPEELVNCPLYVKYIKKQDEFRVHVFFNEVILIQQKKRKLGCENPNWQIRNHANGFVFARAGVETPTQVTEEAKKAVLALGLDFGAVDVVWNARRETAYILEVNTAPGLEGTTVTDYANALRNKLMEMSRR